MSDDVIFFPGPEAFREWLEKHHEARDVLWVGLYKKATGKATMTWDEAVDEALCFGWIDGVRRTVDESSYKTRFTPRRKGSNWSRKNIASVERLSADGRMRPPGIRAFEARLTERSGVYSFEQDGATRLAPALLARFHEHPEAWESFEAEPAGYRRIIIHWVMSARREATRLRRLDRVIEVSSRGRRVDLSSPFRKEL